jgi:hypothetical protein
MGPERQALKPIFFRPLTARLKSCPDTKPSSRADFRIPLLYSKITNPKAKSPDFL